MGCLDVGMPAFQRRSAGNARRYRMASSGLHWASELIHEPPDPDQDPRHLGTVEPLGTPFDLTPAGRPARDEQMEYPCCHGPVNR